MMWVVCNSLMCVVCCGCCCVSFDDIGNLMFDVCFCVLLIFVSCWLLRFGGRCCWWGLCCLLCVIGR